MKKIDLIFHKKLRCNVRVYGVMLFAATFVCLACASCTRSEKKLQHGEGQVATSQDKEQQNRNLIDQVVRAAEEQEKYPDPVYLRSALGRLNSWLAERPLSADFEPDPEFEALVPELTKLSADVRRVNELVKLFTDESKKPEEKDGEELQSLVETVGTQTDALAKKLHSNALAAFTLFFNDLKGKLSGAKEFQFADATETLQTQIRQFVQQPSFVVYNFEALYKGVDDYVSLLKTGEKSFLPQDADFLRESVWFRDVFNWAKGDKQDDLTIVKNLFDWSVRNVILTAPMGGQAGPMAQLPWQTLLLSQGTEMDRAVVFIELLRQHRLDAFVLYPEGEVHENFPLVVGVRLDGEIYLFLPKLGLPIPSVEEGSLVLENGLAFNKIATLREVASNDATLRQFDLDEPFPATSKDFERMVAYVPSTPFVVSSRMIPMEQEFSGSVNTVLSTAFASQKARIAEMNGIVDVQRLQEVNAAILEQAIFPFESDDLMQIYLFSVETKGNLDVSDSNVETDTSIGDYTKDEENVSSEENSEEASVKKTRLSPLWIGKILYLRGQFVDESGAGRMFMQGRVSERVLRQEESSIAQHVREYVAQYAEWKASQQESPSQEELQALANQAATNFQLDIATKRYVKILTSFYLALLSEANQNYDAALERLNDDSLRLVARPNGTTVLGDEWRIAAEYLRARILEKQNKIETAVARYRTNVKTPGTAIRAKWLAQLAGIKDGEPVAEPADATQDPNAPQPAENATEEPTSDVENAQPAEQESSKATDTMSEPAQPIVEEQTQEETSAPVIVERMVPQEEEVPVVPAAEQVAPEQTVEETVPEGVAQPAE